MEQAFRRLATLRRFMSKGDTCSLPDFGREQLRNWIRSQSEPPLKIVSITTLRDINGKHFWPGRDTDDLLIYIHGGGLVYYDTEIFSPFLATLAHQASCEIVALDYPKAPETDSLKIRSLLACDIAILQRHFKGKRIALAGDSVGALLALLFAEGWSGEKLWGLHLIYPVADEIVDRGSVYAKGHFLDADMMEWFHTFIAPLLADRSCKLPAVAANLPPVVVHIAECDILSSGALQLAENLKQSGQKVSTIIHQCLPHDFCLYQASSSGSYRAVSRVAEMIAESFAYRSTNNK